MSTPGERLRALVLGALVASACGCKGRAGSEPGAGPDHPEAPAASATTAGAVTAGAAPALWESIDRSFNGCEGG
jgi:hypothetical protein